MNVALASHSILHRDDGSTVHKECFVWDSVSNAWTQGASMLEARRRAAGVAWDDGTLWITGKTIQ